MASPPPQAAASGGAERKDLDFVFKTETKGGQAVRYNATISDWARFTYCFGPTPCCLCTLNACCWEKVKPRTYFQIQENRIEYNFPMLMLCGCGKCCLYDCVTVHYFDDRLLQSNFKRSRFGSPYHCCCFLELSGQVMVNSALECCNFGVCFHFWPCNRLSHGSAAACCPPCLWAVGGLSNIDDVVDQINKAQTDTRPGPIAVPMPSPRSGRRTPRDVSRSPTTQNMT